MKLFEELDSGGRDRSSNVRFTAVILIYLMRIRGRAPILLAHWSLSSFALSPSCGW